MRTIKFRVWLKEEEKMVYPSVLMLDGGGEGAKAEFFQHTISCVDDETIELMQFTGLTDRNGKEIYEGDIVDRTEHMKPSVMKNKPEVVKWNDKTASFDGLYANLWPWQEPEVIGNIYENPELVNK